jgi:hypothetical protein
MIAVGYIGNGEATSPRRILLEGWEAKIRIRKRGYAWSVTPLNLLAGTTRLELATSGVTGRRSNQLNYAPV